MGFESVLRPNVSPNVIFYDLPAGRISAPIGTEGVDEDTDSATTAARAKPIGRVPGVQEEIRPGPGQSLVNNAQAGQAREGTPLNEQSKEKAA